MEARRRMMMAGGRLEVDFGLPSGKLWTVGNIVKDANGDYKIGKETDYGVYFSWGNIDGYNDGDGYAFTSANYANTGGSSLTANISPTDALHDAAYARLGAPYHLPTVNDFNELFDNTDYEFVSDHKGTGVSGYKVMKKTNHAVYIFFPASGDYGGSTLDYLNSRAYLWTNGYRTSSNANTFRYSTDDDSRIISLVRRHGLTIRAVRDSQ